MLVKDLVAKFREWNVNNRAVKTVRYYDQRLKLFVEDFGERHFRRPLDEDHPESGITPLEIDAFLARVGVGLADGTRRHNAVGLTTLQSFAVKNNILPFDRQIFYRLEKPPMGRRERIPTAEEKDKLLEHASPEFRRAYLALCQCGARPGELCSLQIEGQIDWAAGIITLVQHKTARKTGQSREIAIASKFREMLLEAIGERKSGPVFVNGRGTAWTVEALSSMHRRLRDKAGLDKQLCLYAARHWHATELLRSGVSIKDVADLMGHKLITTTQKYLHRPLREIIDKQDEIK